MTDHALRLLPGILLGLALTLPSAASAAAHPEAVLRSPNSSAEAGTTLPLQGEQFIAGEGARLVLQGALTEYPLGNVTPEEDGTFDVGVAIPRDARPGQYQVVALAVDGDVAARLDLTVLAASEAGDTEADETHEEGADRSATHAPAGEEARADEMPIQRSTSGVEWGFIGLFIGLSAGLGIALLTTRAA